MTCREVMTQNQLVANRDKHTKNARVHRAPLFWIRWLAQISLKYISLT